MVTEEELLNFAAEHNLTDYYKSYAWKRDTWRAGFPDIFALEVRLTAAARAGTISVDDLCAVAKWGSPRSASRVSLRPDTIDLDLYEGGFLAAHLAGDPLSSLRKLDGESKGMGPTLLSKVLRFALPSVYGAIDSSIVSFFGRADDMGTQGAHCWLDLKVSYGGGSIQNPQRGWPSEYATWLAILSHLANVFNEVGDACPHPGVFVDEGLRDEGVWLPADVEMALFAMAR